MLYILRDPSLRMEISGYYYTPEFVGSEGLTTKDGDTHDGRDKGASRCNLVTRISAWSLVQCPFFVFHRLFAFRDWCAWASLLICAVECHQVILFRSFLLLVPGGEFIAMVSARTWVVTSDWYVFFTESSTNGQDVILFNECYIALLYSVLCCCISCFFVPYWPRNNICPLRSLYSSLRTDRLTGINIIPFSKCDSV